MYRSRLYKEIDAYEKYNHPCDGAFKGYDEKGSFVNMGNIVHGRMNNSSQRILYTALDKDTSIFEVDPGCDSYVNVAEIECTQPLKLIDLSWSSSYNDDDFVRYLSLLIQEKISEGNNQNDYYLSQYVSTYCYEHGYDGLMYRSRLPFRVKIK